MEARVEVWEEVVGVEEAVVLGVRRVRSLSALNDMTE